MLNRFAITTDGFRKPNTVIGPDFANSVSRALLITDGYFNATLRVGGRHKRSKFWFYICYFYPMKR